MANVSDQIVAIPSRDHLQKKLEIILRDAKRLRLLIRTAKDLERLYASKEREGRANG